MDRYAGFAEFVAARQVALSRTAYLLTGDHHAAQDLVQTALVKTAAHWSRLVANGDPEGYVRRVMVNEHVTVWRRRMPRPIGTVPDVPVADETARADVAGGPGPCAAQPRSPAGRGLGAAVLRGPDRARDRGPALGCSVGTVKTQTHDALARLRTLLPRPATDGGARDARSP